MRRREFLTGCGLVLIGTRAGRAQAVTTTEKAKAAARERIGVLSWSLHDLWEPKPPAGMPTPAKPWDFLDYPELIADRFGLHNIEVQDENFASFERSYINDVIARMKKTKSRMINICLEVGTYVSDPDPAARQKAVEHTKQWIDNAVLLGCPSVMVNQGRLSYETMAAPIEALKQCAAYGKTKNVFVTIENRGEREPSLLAQILRASGAYANPDIGNFPDDVTRERGMRDLMSIASNNVHVKMSPGRYDLAKYIQMTKDYGFKGTYSIESSRQLDPDPLKAAQLVLDQMLALV